MKVYIVHTGSVHEGGSTDRVYAQKEDAVRYAASLAIDENKKIEEIHKENASSFLYKQIDEIPVVSRREAHWKSSTEEIVVVGLELM